MNEHETEQVYRDFSEAYSKAIVEVLDKYFPEPRISFDQLEEAERLKRAQRAA